MFPVAVQDPLPGSYSAAEASGGLRLALLLPEPPATSTLPSGSSVAVWDWRGVTMFPVAVQDPLLGSYSSAEASALLLPVTLLLPVPPATSTLPSGSSVAVWDWRGVTMLPAAVQDPLPGSYSSAEASRPVPTVPPATSTLPSGSSVAVSWKRSSIIPPVAVHAGAPADGLAGWLGLELTAGVGLG